MPQQSLQFLFLGALATGGVLGHFVSFPSLAQAQIVPDATLGRERSILRTNIPGVQGLIDCIDGGAQRGGNLFHSFLDFNINRGQQVYFANPISINNIISRVTGPNFSSIDGTLGVLGGANLFLINPNGIIFGSNARLDVRGSFVASTADKIPFSDGYSFSATAPESEPLLTVSSPLGLASWQANSGTINAQANLSTGKDLSLIANNLYLQGQLKVGGDLNLIATDTLTARDSTTSPFIASAGNQLLVQGNRAVDIAALNHPDSGLSSGGDMILRSANTVGGDAHFKTGGNFRIEQLDGQPGSLYSPNDPVVQASGDVSFDSYTGASLHILAGGSVIIPGTITITGPEVTGFLSETVTLSNGSTLAIDGSAQPTVDIRAGTTAFGTTGITGCTTGFTPVPGTAGSGTNANIMIGSIVNQSGLVYLSNQYQPNLSLTGDISVGSINTTADPASGLSGGSVVIDSRGQLTFNSINASGGTFDLVPGLSQPDFSMLNIGGNGGDVTLLAGGQVFMPFPSTLFTYGLTGGAITISSDTAIVQENAPRGTDPFALSWIESDSELSGPGGDVKLSAPTISIGGNIFTTMVGEGRGGDINISTASLVTDQATIASQTFIGQGRAGDVTVNASDSITVGIFTTLGSLNFSSGGRAGDVTVQTRQLSITDGGQISSSTFGVGDGGNISVIAEDIALSGFLPGDLATTFVGGGFVPSAIITNSLPGAEGNSGSISITTGTLTLANAAAVSTTAQGIGEAGDITINASRSVAVSGTAFTDFTTPQDLQASAISSELFTGATGRGGSIAITTPILAVTNGGAISASTGGEGDAGSITLNATQSALFDGVATFGSTNAFDRTSRSQVFAGQDATGNGGSLTITTPSLTLSNGGQLTAQTNGVGNAGDLRVNVGNSLNLDGVGSGIFASATLGSTGQGGSIFIANPQTVNIQNRAQITAETQGSGKGGSVQLFTNSLSLGNGGQLTVETAGSGDAGTINLQVNQSLSLDGSNTGIIARTGPTSSGQGGDIVIGNPETVQVLNGAQITAATQGTGKGGNVQVQANSLSLGNGGQVTVETQGSGSAGTINLQLPKALTLDGPNAGLIARTTPGSSGAGGSILINSPEVVQILNGAQITAETQGSGPGGSIQLRGDSLSQINGGKLTVATQDAGNAGSIDLRLGGSLLLNGFNSGLLALTSPASSGSGGKINVQTLGTVKILNSARIAASTEGSGPGGNIDINARAIKLDANGEITAGTKGQGPGGNITLKANRIDVANGAQISGQTLGSGKAGNIKLTVDEALNLQGIGSGILANTGPESTGNGGDISILSLNALEIQNGAKIAVDSLGKGAGGDITIQTRSINLNNAAKITAETAGTKGGNISIFASDPLYMTNNSRISTTAGTAKAGGDGGNIVIRSPFLISGATDNSDITANAYSGRGGRVEITTNGILGMIVRSRSDLEAALGTSDPNRLDPALLPTSDITAISQTNPNLNGVVDIRSLDSDPFQNVYVLPSTTVDASKLVAKGCSTGPTVAKAPGTLVVTGRGGLPPSPTDQLNSSGLVLGWESLEKSVTSSRQPSAIKSAQAQPAPQLIVEAGAIALGPNGQVTLVANATGGDQGTFANQGQVCSVKEEQAGPPQVTQ